MQRLYEADAYKPEIGSWWQETANPPRWPMLQKNTRAHTVIIGGGYTGMNCALELAERHGVGDVVILEAEQPGWGASGRNGGFCCMGGSKLSHAAQVKRFGEGETRKYYNAQIASVESVRENLTRYKIDADTHSEGETLLAHTPSRVEELVEEQTHLKSFLGLDATLIEKNDLAKYGLASPEFQGALTNPVGFALNPLKYASGLARQVSEAGILAFGNSPATQIERTSTNWTVTTPQGCVTSENLVIATNGYSSEDLPEWLAGRLLPTLTNIIVSRPLSESELADQGWTSLQMCYDTRNSLHYFHLLPVAKDEPGPRMMFGMRAGTSADSQSQEKMRKRIRADFDRIFPTWRHVETPYFWSGLVCLTRNLTSFTGPIPDMPNTYASLAYHGNGVAMASHCGRLLANIIQQDMDPDALPAAMRQPPKKFPLPALRRKYLSAAYRYYEWSDR